MKSSISQLLYEVDLCFLIIGHFFFFLELNEHFRGLGS